MPHQCVIVHYCYHDRSLTGWRAIFKYAFVWSRATCSDENVGEQLGVRRREWRLQPAVQIGGPRSIQSALKLRF
jgi:hypothetical protein